MKTILAAVVALWLAAAPAPAQAQAPKPADFELRPSASLQGRVDALAGRLRTSGVDALLDAANRTATANGGCRANAFPDIPAGGSWFCFDKQDAGSTARSDAVEWVPQGVTSTADAGGGRDALLVSWYDARTEPKKGVRVSFLDTASGKYRHVLLVYPYTDSAGQPNYEIVGRPQGGIHAGGIAWYGNRLYVADTTRGVRVFDMRFIFDLASSPNGDTSSQTQIGRHGSKYYGFGYRYVLPQVGAWVNAAGADNDGDFTCAADGAPKFSSVAVDRAASPHRLVTSEYCDSGALGRVARWPIAASGDLQLGTDGHVHATEALRLPRQNIQGALSIGDTFYLSRSRGSKTAGQLLLAGPSGGSLKVSATRTAGIGPEDLSFVPGRVWTVTEHAGRRMLYGVPAGGAALTAAPAHAANEQKCEDSKPRKIKLPRGADIRVTEQTCVIKFPVGTDRAKYKAWVHTTWGPTGSGGIRPKQFEDYNVTARLEINRRGPDRVLGRRTCKIASVINRVASGAYTCQTNVEGNFGTARVWTGDGSVVYDVDGDGKGNFPSWPLDGSPRV